jgi:L-galactonate dehydratase
MLEHAVSYSENLRFPSKVENAHYITPLEPGYSVGYTSEALKKYTYPNGKFWSSDFGQSIINDSFEGEL